MKDYMKALLLGAACAGVFSFPAFATTNLETGSSLAGISVLMNNYYASNEEPEKSMSQALASLEAPSEDSGEVLSQANPAPQTQAAAETTQQAQETVSQTSGSSIYDNIAVSKVSGTVNIRTEANTSSQITGKIYNDCAATILDTVDGEGGKWYKIKSGNVTGYIKAEYFVTGKEAESLAQQVGTTYGTVVGTTSLRLRESPDLTAKTLTLLAEGAHYVVTGQEGDFLKVQVDSDLEGYVFKDYMTTNVEFKEAVSLEEEKAKEEEEQKRKEEADQAIRQLEEVKEESRAQESSAQIQTVEETTKAETTKAKETTKDSGTIAVNPEKEDTTTVAAPTTEKETEETETTAASGPGAGSSSSSNVSSAVAAATRNAVVAYAKQFLGNPYVYGGTSLTEGADCSGFVQSVFAHFGISTGRSSRDQAARGTVIDVNSVQPGDLLFYASGDYINHVGIYIGGGQIIHASNPATGICTAPANYRTPCKAVTFLD